MHIHGLRRHCAQSVMDVHTVPQGARALCCALSGPVTAISPSAVPLLAHQLKTLEALVLADVDADGGFPKGGEISRSRVDGDTPVSRNCETGGS